VAPAGLVMVAVAVMVMVVVGETGMEEGLMGWVVAGEVVAGEVAGAAVGVAGVPALVAGEVREAAGAAAAQCQVLTVGNLVVLCAAAPLGRRQRGSCLRSSNHCRCRSAGWPGWGCPGRTAGPGRWRRWWQMWSCCKAPACSIALWLCPARWWPVRAVWAWCLTYWGGRR
jgi:hypothetical protein